MAQSLSHAHIHIVFSTKDRVPLIDDGVRESLHGYMAGILKQLECSCLLVNSVEDHIHALLDLSRNHSISEVVRDLKIGSSKWIKTRAEVYREFAWQAGYGAFGVSASNVADVRAYIENQREHHRERSFQEEFRLFLDRHGIAYDERYVWD